jgi:hypothetical protein
MAAESRENPAGVVYGIITMGALLAAESARRETYVEAVASASIALLLYWLAHSYASLLGERLSGKEHLTFTTLGRAFIHDWAIVRGASIPLLALLLTWASGASQHTAVNIGVWSSVVCLIAFELIAGLRAKASVRELVVEGSVGAAMGLAIIALKIVLH